MSKDRFLKGKTALVTGSTSGIGLALARGLAGAGADIVFNGLGEKAAVGEARSGIEALGARCLYHGADMSQPAEIAALIEAAVNEFGRIDILVNNAGIQHVAPVDEFPPEKWDSIIAINLSSAFHTTRLSLPHMKRAGWGRVVNIASAHALVASPFKSAYVAAKHGLAGFTKAVALEVAEAGITINAICPGYVRTALVENQIAATAQARGISEAQVVSDVMLKAQWTKKFVTVEELAGTLLFLCSDAAANITGTALSVDGGWTAA